MILQGIFSSELPKRKKIPKSKKLQGIDFCVWPIFLQDKIAYLQACDILTHPHKFLYF